MINTRSKTSSSNFGFLITLNFKGIYDKANKINNKTFISVCEKLSIRYKKYKTNPNAVCYFLYKKGSQILRHGSSKPNVTSQ